MGKLACQDLIGTTSDVTRLYNTEIGYTASKTGNISGIYDTSGGTWEYVMGYNVKANVVGGSSGLNNLYNGFFTDSRWEKYYDKYYANYREALFANYDSGLLGDATKEMGPYQRIKVPENQLPPITSWYNDMAYFIHLTSPWFARGGLSGDGTTAGIFAMGAFTGGNLYCSFRLVLCP